MTNNYHDIRLSYDNKRKIVWSVIGRYLIRSGFLKQTDNILDFGCGYCDFLNTLPVGSKFAYDKWDGASHYVGKDIIFFSGEINCLHSIPRNSIDVLFASNVFEHLTVDELGDAINYLKNNILSRGAKIILIQPNFYYSYRNYFDDYTHKSIWTHVSMEDFLISHGFKAVKIIKNFMPLTVKSQFPVYSFLIWAYLYSPIKIKAGQMLIVAELG